MSTYCYAMVRGSVARFTLLDTKGAPLEGPRSVVVTKGLSSISINEQTEAQSGLMEKTEVGAVRLYTPEARRTINYFADIDLVGVDPDLLPMLTNQSVVLDARGDVSGNDVQTHRRPVSFAMEVWSKLASPVDGYTYGYTLFPRLRGGRISRFQFSSDRALILSIQGARTVRLSRWLLGPHQLHQNPSGGWDLGRWDTGPWDDKDAFTYLTCSYDSEWAEETISPRLGTPIGTSTHWRTMLLDQAPLPTRGATSLTV